MFTGIIKSIGTITSIKKNDDLFEVLIATDLDSEHLNKGDSINVDGICSTIVEKEGNKLKFQYMSETIKRTSVSSWGINTKVNIEPSLTMHDALNGHFVMGHIDSTGKIKSVKIAGDTKDIEIAYPKNLRKFMALKGSISIDGISLTISMLESGSFIVSVIPYTLKHTTLGEKTVDSLVNIEIDTLSRYLKQLFDERDNQTNYEFLKDRGFI
ncbi:riboflavin synthase [bacterium]|nr:riboflavin synthase [bacterium]